MENPAREKKQNKPEETADCFKPPASLSAQKDPLTAASFHLNKESTLILIHIVQNKMLYVVSLKTIILSNIYTIHMLMNS